MTPSQELIKAVCDEVAAMHYAGQLRAIAVVMVDADGHLRTLVGAGDGMKLSLIAGTAVLHAEALGTLRVIEKDRDL